MTIVCATDFSPTSEAALAAAGAIASRTQEDILLVHALDFLDPANERLDLDEARTQAERSLVAAATKLAANVTAPLRSVLLYGPAAEALPELAELRNPSLVVVASRGHGSKPFSRLGGTSERLARDVTTPLLVVRDPAPFTSWAREERPLNVLAGIDHTTSWKPSMAWVDKLREAGPCDVTIAMVYDAGEERVRRGMSRSHSLTTADAELERLVASDIETRVPRHGKGPMQYLPILGIGRMGDHLVDTAHARSTDLVVLGNLRHLGLARFASVASVTLHYAHASVLLVPPPATA